MNNRPQGRLFFCGFPQKNIDKCEVIAYNRNVQWNKSSLMGVLKYVMLVGHKDGSIRMSRTRLYFL